MAGFADRTAAAREAHLRAQAAAAALQATPRGTPVIGQLLCHGDTAVIRGGSATLVALSMATHLAGRADSWAGFPIPFDRHSRVSWIDARSEPGIGAAARAIEQRHCLDIDQRFEIERRTVLLASVPSVVSTIAAAAAGGGGIPPRLLVIDDLAACLFGLDQGKPRDADTAISAILRIQDGLGGCPVVAIDLTEGPLAQIADVVLTAERNGNILTVTTQGRAIPPIHFELISARGAIVPADPATRRKKESK